MGAAAAVIGAQATMAAASAYGQSKAASNQFMVDEATIGLEKAQGEYEIARTAAMESENFRRNLASQVSLASYRGGAGVARQFAGQSFATFSKDLAAVERAYSMNDVRALNKTAQAQANKYTTGIGAITGFASSIIQPASSAALSNLFGSGSGGLNNIFGKGS